MALSYLIEFEFAMKMIVSMEVNGLYTKKKACKVQQIWNDTFVPSGTPFMV